MNAADPQGLERLELLEELCALSRRERVHMARLDMHELTSIARQKQTALDRLQSLGFDPQDPDLAPDTKRRIKLTARRLDIESKTNLALFAEAIELMGHATGAVTPTTYDARARLRSSVAPLARRNL